MDIRDHLRKLGLTNYIAIFEEEEFTEPALLLSMSPGLRLGALEELGMEPEHASMLLDALCNGVVQPEAVEPAGAFLESVSCLQARVENVLATSASRSLRGGARPSCGIKDGPQRRVRDVRVGPATASRACNTHGEAN